MYVGTQIEPRDDSDYQVWAQLGVTHVCVDPPGSPNEWSLDALRRHKDHVESFGLSLDMVQLPISAGPLRAQDKPHVLIANGPEWQLEIDSLCGLIERLAAAGIPAAKYNLSVLGVLRTAPELGRGGSRNKAFRWSWADPNASPTLAGCYLRGGELGAYRPFPCRGRAGSDRDAGTARVPSARSAYASRMARRDARARHR